MSSPCWISHRGVQEGRVENSLAGFQDAICRGFDYLESDLRTTKDGVVVLCHDSSIIRVAGVDRKLEDLSYGQVKSLKLLDGQCFLTLDRFLALEPKRGFILDIKPESAEATLAVLESMSISDSFAGRIRFLFWDKSHERLARHLLGEIEVLADERDCFVAGLKALGSWPGSLCETGRTYSLPPKFLRTNLFDERMVSHYHKRGARLIAFLPSTKREYHDAIAAGFDEILSNGYLVET